MGCFLVPGAEAIVTTVVKKVVDSKSDINKEVKSVEHHTESNVGSFSRKLGWLNNMLWGGSALLLFEHIWHGEVTPFFPFITAMDNQADMAELLTEMSTVGVAMALGITVVWGGMVAVSNMIEKKAKDEVDA